LLGVFSFYKKEKVITKLKAYLAAYKKVVKI